MEVETAAVETEGVETAAVAKVEEAKEVVAKVVQMVQDSGETVAAQAEDEEGDLGVAVVGDEEEA